MTPETAKLSDPIWEKRCREALEECLKDPQLGGQEWFHRRHALDLLDPNKKVRLVGIDLSGKNLTDYGFPFCYLIDVNFQRADLRGVRLDKTVIDGCHFEDADLSGANLNAAHLVGRTFFVPSFFSNAILTLRLAHEVYVGKLLLDEIKRQNLVAEQKRTPASLMMRGWHLLSDYGARAGKSLLLVSVVCIAIFAVIYYAFLHFTPEAFGDNKPASGWSLLIFSFERFINSSSAIETSSSVLRLIQNLETVLGLVAFAILTAWIVRSVLRDG